MPKRSGIIESGAVEFIEQTSLTTTSIFSILDDRQYYVLTLTQNGYFLFGDNDVAASSTTAHYLAAGTELRFHADSEIGLYLSISKDSASGTGSLSRVRD